MTANIKRPWSNFATVFILWLIQVAFLFRISEATACSSCVAGITVAPTSQWVPVGANATFNCHGSGSVLQWEINGTQVDPRDRNSDRIQDFRARGFIIEVSGESCVHNSSITVVASPVVNNTQIQCIVFCFSDSIAITSDLASIIVMGAPSTPNPVLEVINTTSLLLSWPSPFTWPGYEILNYTITIKNTSSNIVESKTIVAAPNDREIEFWYHADEGASESCADLIFNVTASNALGESPPATVRGRLPMAPQSFTSPVMTRVLFLSDGTPVLEIEFQPPRMCPMQEFEYTISMQKVNSTESFLRGPMNATYSENKMIMHEVSDGITVNAVYSVRVTISTPAGNSSSEKTFRTEFSPTEPSATTNSPNGSEFRPTESPSTSNNSPSGSDFSSTATPATNNSQSEKKDVVLIIIVILVGGVTLLASIALVLVFICVQQRLNANKKSDSARHACSAMVPNPIYEGPLYEMIHPKFDSLVAGCSPSITEVRYLDNPIQPSQVNESLKQQVCPFTDGNLKDTTTTVALPLETTVATLPLETTVTTLPPESSVLKNEDEYTVMKSVSLLSPTGGQNGHPSSAPP